MLCRRWKPEELLPKAELLAHLLKEDPRILDVAMTGSLARFKPKIHDIDLVVFHDGSMKDGSAQDPERTEPYYNNDLSLSSVLPPGLARHLSQARSGVQVNYIFVTQRALWDCTYLQSLEKQENFTEFHRRIFCDLPLILLNPIGRCGVFLNQIVGLNVVSLNQLTGCLLINGLVYSGVFIKHQCENICEPRIKWEECRKEIKRRKNHWWHPFS